MPSLVLELQQEAMNPQVKVSDLLRRALVVATKLNLEEFRAWIEKELKGYKDNKVPSYRSVRGEVKVQNPYHGLQPVIFEDSQHAKSLSESNIGTSIGELEDLLKGDEKGILHVRLPDETVSELAKSLMGMPPVLIVGQAQIYGIVDAVRNGILEWSLKLEKDGILGAESTFSREEKEKAQASSTTYNIQKFVGVMGTVHSNVLQIGDFNSIHAELKHLGIPQADRNRLESIMDQVKDAKGLEKSSLVQQGLSWVLEHGPQLGALAEMLRNWFQSQGGG